MIIKNIDGQYRYRGTRQIPHAPMKPATSGNIRQHPATSGNIRQHPATSGNIRQHPATSGIYYFSNPLLNFLPRNWG